MDAAKAAGKNRFQFTVARLEKLSAPATGRTYVYDTLASSLTLCITSAGAKTFYVYRKVNGRPVRYRLGKLDEMSVEAARKQAAIVVAAYIEGRDPQNERQLKRVEPTLGNLFDYWLDTHAKPRKKTWREDEATFNRYIKSWRGRRLSSIRKPDIKALHNRVGKDHGIYAANRLRGMLHTLFSHASDVGYQGSNPVKGVAKFREKSRERFLQADEFPQFWESLEKEPSETCRDFFKIALLTGARRGNVLAMRWAEVNLDRATWAIPDTKSGEALTLPLSPEAVEILQERFDNRKDGAEWVFPGHVRGTHLKDPTKPWKAILERAGLKDLRIHDLRRTLGSWQAATGASLPVIGKSLGHKLPSTTAIYSRLNLDPVRESVGRATTAMMAAAKPKPAKKKDAAKAEGGSRAKPR